MGRICVVHDDREQTRHRLELLLLAHADVDEVVVAPTREDLVARAAEGPTDLVVLGLARGGSAAGLVAAVRAAAPSVAVLVAGSPDDPAVVGEAVAAGASGWLRWDSPRALTRTLAGVAAATSAGDDLLLPGAGEDPVLVDRAVQRTLEVSAREVQVLVGVSRGMTNAEIGRRLYLSAATVKSHTTRLFRRLDAADRAEAVGRAWLLGLFVRRGS